VNSGAGKNKPGGSGLPGTGEAPRIEEQLRAVIAEQRSTIEALTRAR